MWSNLYFVTQPSYLYCVVKQLVIMLLKSRRIVKRNERFVISLMCVWLKEWESGMIENEYAFALFGRDKKKLGKKKW